jgi:hypothetical protein
MNVGVQVLKVLGTILAIWLGGYLAVERLGLNRPGFAGGCLV